MEDPVVPEVHLQALTTPLTAQHGTVRPSPSFSSPSKSWLREEGASRLLRQASLLGVSQCLSAWGCFQAQPNVLMLWSGLLFLSPRVCSQHNNSKEKGRYRHMAPLPRLPPARCHTHQEGLVAPGGTITVCSTFMYGSAVEPNRDPSSSSSAPRPPLISLPFPCPGEEWAQGTQSQGEERGGGGGRGGKERGAVCWGLNRPTQTPKLIGTLKVFSHLPHCLLTLTRVYSAGCWKAVEQGVQGRRVGVLGPHLPGRSLRFRKPELQLVKTMRRTHKRLAGPLPSGLHPQSSHQQGKPDFQVFHPHLLDCCPLTCANMKERDGEKEVFVVVIDIATGLWLFLGSLRRDLEGLQGCFSGGECFTECVLTSV
ncbi:hypothetical protein JOQ06_023754, partial [Pogonophryne albipinna]